MIKTIGKTMAGALAIGLVVSIATTEPAAARPLQCHADLPFGGSADFTLAVRPTTIVMDMGGGNVRVFQRNRAMSDARLEVASAKLAPLEMSSIMIDSAGRFQQTFVERDSVPVFVYGVCR